jgi:hypothetical protein
MTEALQKVNVVCVVRVQHFDCNHTVETRVTPAEDGRHAAVAEFFFYFVALVEDFWLHVASVLNQIVVVSQD